jgi:hypothetical protein
MKNEINILWKNIFYSQTYIFDNYVDKKVYDTIDKIYNIIEDIQNIVSSNVSYKFWMEIQPCII